MAYKITNTLGAVVARVADGVVDTTSTTLALIGRNVSGYGNYLNENAVTLLTNHASQSFNQPNKPLQGQLWYDITHRRLKIYDRGFTSVAGAVISGPQPSGLSAGDFWYSPTSNALNFFNGSGFISLYTAPQNQVNGWIYPTPQVGDVTTPIPVVQQVTLLQNFGNQLGLMSNSQFAVNTSDLRFPVGLVAVAGITVVGDVKATGSLHMGSHPPATLTSPGLPGQMTWDANKLYIATGTNTWSTIPFGGSGGGGGGSSGLSSRTTASGVTSSIAANTTGTFQITGFKGYALYKISVSAAAWVRLYTTQTARTLDTFRSPTVDPTPDAGVIAEVITTASQTVSFSPAVVGFNNEASPNTDIAVSVTNLSGGTTAITVVLTLLKLES